MKTSKGFSLIEVLIVLCVLGVITAIAIPNLLASKRAANEGTAQSSLRTIHGAQATYQSTMGNGVFAPSLSVLNNQNLIDGVLASGFKSGYKFAIIQQIGTGSTAEFSAYGVPAQAIGIRRSGARRFGITEIGVMRGDGECATIPDSRQSIERMIPLGE